MDTIDRPAARQDRLVVQELSDEVLVYDLDRHRAHCLNRAAALIWRHCDGSTSVAEMARRLRQESGELGDEEAVRLGLSRLSKAHLLQERVRHPAQDDRATRRALIRRLAAIGGVALVSSIAAPAWASASVPLVCINSCCCCFSTSPATCDCNTNESCKCCFIGDTANCAKDCGEACQSIPGGTCVQISNSICATAPKCGGV